MLTSEPLKHSTIKLPHTSVHTMEAPQRAPQRTTAHGSGPKSAVDLKVTLKPLSLLGCSGTTQNRQQDRLLQLLSSNTLRGAAM